VVDLQLVPSTVDMTVRLLRAMLCLPGGHCQSGLIESPVTSPVRTILVCVRRMLAGECKGGKKRALGVYIGMVRKVSSRRSLKLGHGVSMQEGVPAEFTPART
jgi:hypothetical protein